MIWHAGRKITSQILKFKQTQVNAFLLLDVVQCKFISGLFPYTGVSIRMEIYTSICSEKKQGLFLLWVYQDLG